MPQRKRAAAAMFAAALLAAAPTLSAGQPAGNAPIAIDEAATVGAYAIDLENGGVVWRYNENKWLTPASVTKLLTTGAALMTKGGGARLQTRIELTTDSSGRKALCARGEFDPTTDSRYFDPHQMAKETADLAAKLKAQGVTEIAEIVADDTPAQAGTANPKALWEDIGNHYGASPTIVGINDNNVDLYFSTPRAAGEYCRLDSVRPDVGGLRPKTTVMTHASAKDKSQVYLGGVCEWHATGRIPQGRKTYRVRSAMPEPVTQYLESLAAGLRKNGISAGRCRTGRVATGQLIMSVYSPTLAEIIKVTNHESVNLFADALAFNMAMGKVAAKTGVTWEDAANAVMSFWSEKEGLDMDLNDGSGLSTQDAVSAKTVVRAIAAVRRSPEWESYKHSLPVVGESGTVRLLGQGTAIAGNARAKSGSMTGVMAYAGVLKTQQGRELAFCIIVNHYKESTGTIRAKIAQWLVKMYNDKK